MLRIHFVALAKYKNFNTSERGIWGNSTYTHKRATEHQGRQVEHGKSVKTKKKYRRGKQEDSEKNIK
jgi:hypothetical protein